MNGGCGSARPIGVGTDFAFRGDEDETFDVLMLAHASEDTDGENGAVLNTSAVLATETAPDSDDDG
eukprot:9045896-Pyramimonas_sp.AAC.1